MHVDAVFDAYAQTDVIKTLLDNGFVVLTPAAPASLFWETNIPPWDVDWTNSSDYRFMFEMFDHIENRTTFGGKCDFGHMFATGISSGGVGFFWCISCDMLLSFFIFPSTVHDQSMRRVPRKILSGRCLRVGQLHDLRRASLRCPWCHSLRRWTIVASQGPSTHPVSPRAYW